MPGNGTPTGMLLFLAGIGYLFFFRDVLASAALISTWAISPDPSCSCSVGGV